MKRLRLIVIGWMLLWLAGNGALAALMPFCEHAVGHDRHAAAMVQHGHHGAHAHAVASQTVEHGQPASFLDDLCDNCDLCHLASSVLPSDASMRDGPSARGAYLAGRLSPPASRFPDPPQHVPLVRF